MAQNANPNNPSTDGDERWLICEGACNPNVREYDEVAGLWTMNGKPIVDTLNYWLERLVHTKHERVGPERWDIGRGWIRTFRCTQCGSTRRF